MFADGFQHTPPPWSSADPSEGLLLSYGQDFPDFFRRAAAYTDKILKGAKPADLPVEQPTKFKLVLNLKTANALGVGFPQSLILSADEMIGA
jgi:putative tryptophan/tyrosine transport system substrate-binding protein